MAYNETFRPTCVTWRNQKQMKSVAAAVAFMWLASFCGDALAEVVQGQVFNVRDHGATGDGKSLDTAAIQKALDACGDAGGGTVLLPPGTYLSRPLVIRTKTKLLVESGATLRATDDPADYKRDDDPKKFTPFLSGEDLEDVTIAGRGRDRRGGRAMVGRCGGRPAKEIGVHAAAAEYDRAHARDQSCRARCDAAEFAQVSLRSYRVRRRHGERHYDSRARAVAQHRWHRSEHVPPGDDHRLHDRLRRR